MDLPEDGARCYVRHVKFELGYLKLKAIDNTAERDFMTISKSIAKNMVFGSLILAASIYIVFANSLSEEEMIKLAYFWVPVCVTGAVIWYTGQNTMKYAALTFIATALQLLVFFEVIFPML